MTKTTYMWDELSDNVAAEYDDGVLAAAYKLTGIVEGEDWRKSGKNV